MLRGRSRSAIRGWSPVPASDVPALSLSLTERQRVGADEGFRLAMTQIVDVGAASLECTSLVKGNPMVLAICFEKTGGPEVLTWQQVSVDTPGPGQVRLKHTAVGLNHIDAITAAGSIRCHCRAGSAARGAVSSRSSEPHGTLYSGSSEVRTAIDDAFEIPFTVVPREDRCKAVTRPRLISRGSHHHAQGSLP
jgi:hypothetical protein